MYLTYYNLMVKPFQISTDSKFLWLGEKHKEALAILKYGILDSRGFLLLTGDVGTGKTTLIHALINSLGDQIVVATVPDPGLEQLEFFNFIAQAFDMNQTFSTKGSFLVSFREFLYNNYTQNKKVLLIVDEAQRLSPQLLEEIRLLSNIEKEDQKLLNIFFVGQNEFNDFLLESKNRALRQRITLSFNIDPLTESETREYIEHRLFIAGSQKKIFSPDAIHEIFNYSKGYPRLINIICDHALLTGFVEEKEKIRSKTVKECAGELSIPTHARKSVEAYPSEFDWVNQSSKIKPSALSVKRILGYTVIILLVIFITALLVFPNRMLQYFSNATHNFKRNTVPVGQPNPEGTTMPRLPQNQISVVTEKTAQAPTDVNVTREDLHNPPHDINSWLITEQKLFIFYKYNSNELSDKAVETLDRLAKTMAVDPTLKIDIKGYTDASGHYNYNKKLSEFRANIVKSYLVAKGVNPLNITAVGMGPENPIVNEKSPNDGRSNRRVEIELRY